MTAILNNDALTACRLAVRGDGKVDLALMISIWNMLGWHDHRLGVDDLPEGMRRQGDVVVVDALVEALELSSDDIVSETFRLCALHQGHRAPDDDGWFNLSNITRMAVGLGIRRALEKEGRDTNFARHLRGLPAFETQTDDNRQLVRRRLGALPPAPAMVTVSALCPGDAEPRMLQERESFGAAYQALLAEPVHLTTHGTRVMMVRGKEERQITYDAIARQWRQDDGQQLRRIDPSDPVMHTYTNGHLVGALVGFVSTSRSGRTFANVAIPINSPGDQDAHLNIINRREVGDVEKAVALLRARTDLDHVFEKVEPYDGLMGVWLAGMR